MQRARAFFYVCAGVFLLALSWHLGVRSATAQQGSVVSGFAAGIDEGAGVFYVMTPSGDVYVRSMVYNGPGGVLHHFGNFWTGSGPVPTQSKSWGELKARYR